MLQKCGDEPIPHKTILPYIPSLPITLNHITLLYTIPHPPPTPSPTLLYHTYRSLVPPLPAYLHPSLALGTWQTATELAESRHSHAKGTKNTGFASPSLTSPLNPATFIAVTLVALGVWGVAPVMPQKTQGFA